MLLSKGHRGLRHGLLVEHGLWYARETSGIAKTLGDDGAGEFPHASDFAGVNWLK